ncbi:hypothetical protein Tco_0493950 [Tanacetum coccineum]
MNYINAKFESIGFECLLKINDKIVPRFVLEFYSQLEFNYNSEGHFVVNFVIQNKPFSFTLEEFGNILGIPSKGHCSYSDKWSLDYLEISSPSKSRYQTTPPSSSVIKTLIQTPQQGGHRDHVPACLCHMLYFIETFTKYNLAFFILRRMESIRNTPKAILPYGMLLTRLFTHIVSNLPESSNDRYILCDRVMHPLAPHYERKTRSDHGTKICRSSNPSSSSNVLDHPSSSHHINENNGGNDEESFHSNTSSPTQLVNSLSNIVNKASGFLTLSDPYSAVTHFGGVTDWYQSQVVMPSSTVTYTSVYTDSEPGRVFWGADEELSDGGPP